MKKKRVIFLLTLAVCLEPSFQCWSMNRPLVFKLRERETTSSLTQNREQACKRTEMEDESVDIALNDDANKVALEEHSDISQLTFNNFKTALEDLPNAARFILTKGTDGSVTIVAEEADPKQVQKVTWENETIVNAFKLLLEAQFPEADFSCFFENNGITPSFSPNLDARTLRDILDYCQQWEQIPQKRNLLSAEQSLMPSPSPFQEKEEGQRLLSTQFVKQNIKKSKIWNWKSAGLATATLLLSHISSAAAQPFVRCSPLCYPNGTKMGLSWNNSPNFPIYNASQDHFNFVPYPCTLAERLYKQAHDATEKASEACFQTLEHPTATLQAQWQDTFLQSIPLKENWMAAEALCQEALSHLENLQLPRDWLLNAITSSQQRQEEWMDAARWYPSDYTEEFQKDFSEYKEACVIDAAEKEGPEEGQKTKQIMLKIFSSYYPFIAIEKIMHEAMTVTQSAMLADHLLITLKDGEEEPRRFLEKLSHLNIPLTIEKASPYEPIYQLNFKKPSLKSFWRVLQASSKIALVSEPDYLSHSSTSSAQSNNHIQISPNDPIYSNQSNLASISAPEAWNIQQTSPNTIITIIDSGMLPHDDLNQNMWNNSHPLVHYAPYEYQHGFTGNPAFNITADDNHGIHCSGIIGAVGNNSLGITGITWKAQLMFCKAAATVGNKILWQYQAIMNCIDHAWHNNASIINFSSNDNAKSTEVFNALKRAHTHGVIVVTSAGNDGKNLDQNFSYPPNHAKTPQNPTGLDNIIVVGAVDDNDQWASLSNYGPNTVHLAAPGVNILSTVGNTSSYERMSGTSMAAPHVAGTLALMKEQFPGKPYIWLIEKLLNATDHIPSLMNKTIYGRLNIAKALEPESQTCPTP